MSLSIVILAAGNGSRMRSSLPKVLHPLAGVPMLLRVVQTAHALNPSTVCIVYGETNAEVRERFPELDVTWVLQKEQRGTGHAVLQALPHLKADHRVLVLYGDVPLITPQTLENLLLNTPVDGLGLLVADVQNPTGLGRILRDPQGNVLGIVEHKDATPEQRNIREINTGILTVSSTALSHWLPQLGNQNAQGEYYLTDVVSFAVKKGMNVHAEKASCAMEVSGVNDRVELMRLERHYQGKIAHEFLVQGVSISDPARFDGRGTLTIEKDVSIDVNVVLEEVTIGEGTTIGPNCVLKNVTLGRNVMIKSHTVIEDAVIGDGSVIGPFARIRPNTVLGERVHVGNFVELKNAQIDCESKVNHLTYLGDVKVGSNVNVGAGTITCNYDGKHKHTTLIQAGAFIGSGSQLVAPVTIGEGAYIGAGSTITKDAPDNQLTLARARQQTVKGWKKDSSAC